MTRTHILLSLGTLLLIAASIPFLWQTGSVSGTVLDGAGKPVRGAIVRVKATDTFAVTDSGGRYTLAGFEPRFRVHLTAWAEGHYVSGSPVFPWTGEKDLQLTPLATTDNRDYSWIPAAIDTRSGPEQWLIQSGLSLAAKISFDRAFLPLSERLTLGCRDCHRQIVEEWTSSTHASGNQNSIFMTMYNGTDVHGNQSPPTPIRDNPFYYGRLAPSGPDDTLPYYGPGFKLDFPEISGNCATCHLPGASTSEPYGTDPNSVAGVNASGAHCDFCHKIAAVKLEHETGLPAANLPGVLSLELLRPEAGQQVFFGPFDDVDVGPDTYLPLVKRSEVCAPCHSASFWNVPIYQSFDEWLQSPYAEEGTTCQNCHMAPSGRFTNFAPGRGGLERDPMTLASHTFPGAADSELLESAVTLQARAERTADRLEVEVTIDNDGTGHHIPTDSPLRHLILVVRARDEDGNALPQLSGPTLPAWCGVGDPADGYYAGLPGVAYAKILEELWTGVSPTGAYWIPTRIVGDNRIPALASAASTYTFSLPPRGDIDVDVVLLFRRAFIDLVDIKGWDVSDIVLAERSIPLTEDP